MACRIEKSSIGRAPNARVTICVAGVAVPKTNPAAKLTAIIGTKIFAQNANIRSNASTVDRMRLAASNVSLVLHQLHAMLAATVTAKARMRMRKA